MPGYGIMNTPSSMKTWIARFNPFKFPLGFRSYSFPVADSTRRRSIPAGHTMEPWAMLDIAARHGLSLLIACPQLGTPKRLRKIRTPTRFAGEHYIISDWILATRR